jgi:hypothetical protein
VRASSLPGERLLSRESELSPGRAVAFPGERCDFFNVEEAPTTRLFIMLELVSEKDISLSK